MNIMKAPEDDIFKLTKDHNSNLSSQIRYDKDVTNLPPREGACVFSLAATLHLAKVWPILPHVGVAVVHNWHVSKSFNFQPILQNKQ